VKAKSLLTFRAFKSSCIGLGRYDPGKKELTVQFNNRDPQRSYRYSKVSSTIWKKLNVLNQTGGVGEYFNETVVQHPERYPFEEITVRSFNGTRKSKKPKTKN
jgi:hypothetical protein